MPTGERDSSRLRLAIIDGGSFIRTYAGEVRPQWERFNRFVEAVARSGRFSEVRYVCRVRKARIWEVEPPIDPVDESVLRIVPAAVAPGLAPRNWLAIDRAVAASDLVWLQLPGRNAVLALAAARRHRVPVLWWLEGGARWGVPSNLARRYGQIITPSPELFASAVTADEIDAARRSGTPFNAGRRIIWAISDPPSGAEVGRIGAAVSDLEVPGGRVTLAVISDRPIRPGIDRALSALPGEVEDYGYVGDRRSYMELLRGGAVLLHVAQEKGFPTVIVDAMAAGVPVVAVEAAWAKAFLGEGERGRLVPTADPQVLARTVAALLQDEPARARLREAALHWAAANTADVHAARLGDRLRELYPTLGW